MDEISTAEIGRRVDRGFHDIGRRLDDLKIDIAERVHRDKYDSDQRSIDRSFEAQQADIDAAHRLAMWAVGLMVVLTVGAFFTVVLAVARGGL